MNQIARLFLLFMVFVLGTASIAIKLSGASDQTITCAESGCTGITGSLFSVNNAAPNQKFQQTVTVINNAVTSREFGISLTNFSDKSLLAQHVLITIYDEGDTQPIWGPKSLLDLKNLGQMDMVIIPAGSTKKLLFTATLADVGDSFQKTTVSFDLVAGFKDIDNQGNVLAANDPQVLGTSTAVCKARLQWWIILLIQAVSTVATLFFKLKRLPSLILVTCFALISWLMQMLLSCEPHRSTIAIFLLGIIMVFIPSQREST